MSRVFSMNVDDKCVFCDIVSGKEQAEIVSSWENALAFVPLKPVTDGHVLVIPRTHVVDAADNPEVTGMTTTHAARYAQVLHEDFNLVMSSGPDATQTVMHLHVHVVPRHPGDMLSLPWDNR